MSYRIEQNDNDRFFIFYEDLSFSLLKTDDIEHCHFFSYFLPNLQLNIGKKYLKTAKIIDESLIFAIVLRNYSTKPSYIFQLKREMY
jgi:hypothetical protein